MGCFNQDGALPILVLSEGAGSGKTTMLLVYCSLVDPRPGPCGGDAGAPMKDEWAIMLAAQTQRLLSLDNLTAILDPLADMLCRLSTGAHSRDRAFFTQLSEVALAAKRPVVLTSTRNIAVRDDVADRSLFPVLRRRAAGQYRTEEQLWSDYESVWPSLLGCIFDAVSVGLANKDLHLAGLPRLADFVQWVSRCELGLGWTPGSFLAAFNRSQRSAAETVVDNDPVGSAVRDFMAAAAPKRALFPTYLPGVDGWSGAGWSGTASALLKELEKLVGQEAKRDKRWPKLHNKLSEALTQVVGGLSQLGIEFETSLMFADSSTRREDFSSALC